jgi:hypothetical protein
MMVTAHLDNLRIVMEIAWISEALHLSPNAILEFTNRNYEFVSKGLLCGK